MKQVIFILMAIFLATGTAFSQQEGGAVIAADVTTHDFGEINEKDGKVTHSFTVKNEGDAPLIITRVIASCGCTTPEWTKEPIAPGKEGTIKVTFDPVNRPGPFAKTISVYSNGKKGSFIFTIRGDVKQ